MRKVKQIFLFSIMVGLCMFIQNGPTQSASAAPSASLSITTVYAPGINCVFDIDCTITVSDSTAPINLPFSSGSGFLQSRTFPIGEAGTPASGLYTYEYRIDVRNLVGSTAAGCITTFSIPFGPIVPLNYTAIGGVDDVYVITRGGIGNVEPASATQTGDTVTFTFAPAICAGSSPGNGDSSFFFGLTSTQPPQEVTASLAGTLSYTESLAARAPQPGTTHMLTLNPLFDANVNLTPGASATHPKDQYFYVGYDEFDFPQIGLLQFDLSAIPAGATIESAQLNVWHEASADSTVLEHNICVKRVDGTWNESVTAASSPAIDNTCQSSTKVKEIFGIHHWNQLTDLVQNWVDGSQPNYGLALQTSPVTFGLKAFQSVEGNVRPELKINYTVLELPEVEESYFYGFEGEDFPLQIALNQIAVLATDGVTPEEIEKSIGGKYDLTLSQKLDEAILIFNADSNKSREAIVQLARELAAEMPNLVAQAGLVVRGADLKEDVSIVSDQFIVQLAEGVELSELENLNDSNGVKTVMQNPYNPGEYLLAVTEESDADGLEMANRYHEESIVAFAHPNFISHLGLRTPPNDPLFDDQWHLNNIGQGGGTADADADVLEAWDISAGSNGVVIAIIDGGFDMTHPDLLPNYDAARWDFAGCDRSTATLGCGDNDPSPTLRRGDRHGTSVAGVAAARGNNMLGVSGSCPNCRIMPIRRGNSRWADALAFDFARINNADVLNNSWGYTLTSTAGTPNLISAINRAAETGRSGMGAVIFFAMNNRNVNDCVPGRPDISALPNVIGISRSTNKDVFDQSGFGDCMDLLAPTSGASTVSSGRGTLAILTTDEQGTTGYNDGTSTVGLFGCTQLLLPDYTNCFNGTSSAAPLTAGIVGLILDANPNLTREQVQRLLQDTADKIEPSAGGYNANTGFSFNAAVSTATHGYGRVNAFEAVKVAAPDSLGGLSSVDIFVRDNYLDWGNTEQPSSTLFETTREFIRYWDSLDIKTDAPDADGNYRPAPTTSVEFDAFVDEAPLAGYTNKIYVRVHNRGTEEADNVTVKLHWAFAGSALPGLPSDFWTAFPADSSDTSQIHPLGTRTINNLGYSGASVAGTAADQSQVVSFDFDAPPYDPTQPNPEHYCLFAVIDSPQDPIVNGRLSLHPDGATPVDNNITQRNLNVINSEPSRDHRFDFLVRNPFDEPITSLIRFNQDELEEQKWSITFESIKPNEPFELEPGEEVLVNVEVVLPEKGVEGELEIVQMRQFLSSQPHAVLFEYQVMGGVNYQFEKATPLPEPPNIVWHSWSSEAEERLKSLQDNPYGNPELELVQFKNEAELLEKLKGLKDPSEGPDLILGPALWVDELIEIGLADAYCLPGQCPACEGANPPPWCPYASGDFSLALNADFDIASLCAEVGDCVCLQPNPPSWCWAAELAPKAQPIGGIDLFQASFARQFDDEIFPIGIPIWWDAPLVVLNPDWMAKNKVKTPKSLDEIFDLANDYGDLVGMVGPCDVHSLNDQLAPLAEIASCKAAEEMGEFGIILMTASQYPTVQPEVGPLFMLPLDGFTPNVQVEGIYMNPHSENREAALNAAYLIAGQPMQQALHKVTGALPTHGGAWAEFADDAWIDLSQQGLLGILDIEPELPDFTQQPPLTAPELGTDACGLAAVALYQRMTDYLGITTYEKIVIEAQVRQFARLCRLHMPDFGDGLCALEAERFFAHRAAELRGTTNAAGIAADEAWAFLEECNNRSTTATIDPAIASSIDLSLDDDVEISILFPANAISETIGIILQPGADADEDPDTAGIVFPMFYISAYAADDGQEIKKFDKPFELKVSYDSSKLVGDDESSLHLSYWDEEAQQWVEVPSEVDPSTNMVTASLDHLTTFTLQETGSSKVHTVFLPLIGR
ncbi:MAG: S8 family serine peptidase [Anaerolineae bacterium]